MEERLLLNSYSANLCKFYLKLSEVGKKSSIFYKQYWNGKFLAGPKMGEACLKRSKNTEVTKSYDVKT